MEETSVRMPRAFRALESNLCVRARLWYTPIYSLVCPVYIRSVCVRLPVETNKCELTITAVAASSVAIHQ